MSVQITENAKISFLGIRFEDDTADKMSNIIFRFDHILFLPEKVYLEITFPSDIKITNTIDITVSAILEMNNSMVRSIIQNTNTILIYNPTDKYYKENTMHSFSIKNIKNPVSFNILMYFIIIIIIIS